MRTIWANQYTDYTPNSIFLAGPTPRSDETYSWRGEAVEILRSHKFNGTVFVPEDENGTYHYSYMDQIEWEDTCLLFASCIAFWIPRDLETMPGFTTNIEWGKWNASGKVVLGAPEGTPKMRYLYYYAEKYGVPTSHTLEETMQNAIDLVKKTNL